MKIKKGKTEIELPAAPADRGVLYLRVMQAYMARRDIPLRDIWHNGHVDPHDTTTPLIRDVIPYTTLLGHSTRHGWSERREQMWEEIERRALAQLQTDLTAARVRELQFLNAAATVVQQHVFGVPDPANPGSMIVNPAKPRSLEGLINAMVRLDGHIEEKRVGAATAMIEARTSGGDLAEVVVPPVYDDALDEAEIEEMARWLAQKRAEKSAKAMRARRGLAEEEEE
jgi:hypothetical protein